MLEQTWVLFIQGLLSPGTRRRTMSVCGLLLICELFLGLFLPLQLFLFKLQLQHNSAQLHVEIVSSLQFPLIVLTNIQSMPEKINMLTCHSGGRTLIWPHTYELICNRIE